MYSAQRDRFDNLENNKNLGQKNVQDLNPDQIIAEIDQLEARVRDSKRLLQQERDSVLQLSQIKIRNEAESTKLADDISRLRIEERQFDERERFLLQACHNAEQSTCLLMQLETQARTKLNEEINGTITKENELNRQLEVYKMAALKVQEGFNKSEDYHKIEQLQIELANKMKLLTSYQNQLEKTHQEKGCREDDWIIPWLSAPSNTRADSLECCGAVHTPLIQERFVPSFKQAKIKWVK